MPMPSSILALLVASSAVTAFAADSNKPLSNAELRAMQTMVLRERDARQIENLMSRRSQLQLLGRQDLIFDLYSKKQPDISWGSNNGYQVGQETLRKFFRIGDNSGPQHNLENMIKLYPEIENKPENYGVGSYGVHALFDPIIEVAEDGQTAKGFWHTFGPMIGFRDNKPTGTLVWEKYGVDFIKEDGEWRLWHVNVYTDFSIGLGQSLADKVAAPAAPPPPGAAPANNVRIYEEWSPKRVPISVQLPAPYKTFKDTFSYGPPATVEAR